MTTNLINDIANADMYGEGNHIARTLTLQMRAYNRDEMLGTIVFRSPTEFAVFDPAGQPLHDDAIRAAAFDRVMAFYGQEVWDRVNGELAADGLSISWLHLITADVDSWTTAIGSKIQDILVEHQDALIALHIIFNLVLEHVQRDTHNLLVENV